MPPASVSITPALPPARECERGEAAVEEDAARASRLVLEGNDRMTLTPAEAAAAAAASSFSRSLCHVVIHPDQLPSIRSACPYLCIDC